MAHNKYRVLLGGDPSVLLDFGRSGRVITAEICKALKNFSRFDTTGSLVALVFVSSFK